MITSESRKAQIIKDFESKNINFDNVLNKVINIKVYSDKKINLCYEKLKNPKIEYLLIMKDNTIININKTIYEYLNIKENLTYLKNTLERDFINLNLYERFKNKDYKHLNFLSNSEKKIIFITELFFKEDYKRILEEI